MTMVENQNDSTFPTMLDTTSKKSDSETFEWFRSNCYNNFGALPTMSYFLHQRAGKLNDDDLIKEKEYFRKQVIEFENILDSAKKNFQELKGKNDSESQKKLISIAESLNDYSEYMSKATEIIDIFTKAIAENAQAIENLRKIKVGAKFKAARLKHNLSQEKVGKYVGVATMRVSDYEAGKTEPPIKTLLKLVKLLDLSLDELYEIPKKTK